MAQWLPLQLGEADGAGVALEATWPSPYKAVHQPSLKLLLSSWVRTTVTVVVTVCGCCALQPAVKATAAIATPIAALTALRRLKSFVNIVPPCSGRFL
jgi:hypothetical protein